ncbi:MAG TPA: outer membrane beta-barrel protein [Candidatus Sulfotelmatobacter sp.]|jgi:opacity protein-like surface antigen
MIGKFASALVLLSSMVLLGAPGFSQTAPADQTAAPVPATQQPAAQPPAAQQPDTGQEPSEETAPRRRVKPRTYKPWSFNAGLGANLDSGTTKTFVRGGGYDGTVGAARNASKYLGLRGDFLFADLPLRQSSLALAQAQSATSYLFALTVGPVINIPVTKDWGGYIVFGPGYYRRFGTLSDDTAIPGSSCNAFYKWWDGCPNVSIPLSGNFIHSSQNDFGYNIGAGISRKMPSGVELYAEYRLMHGSANGTTTDVRPITIGVRW